MFWRRKRRTLNRWIPKAVGILDVGGEREWLHVSFFQSVALMMSTWYWSSMHWSSVLILMLMLMLVFLASKEYQIRFKSFSLEIFSFTQATDSQEKTLWRQYTSEKQFMTEEAKEEEEERWQKWVHKGFPGSASGRERTCQWRRYKRHGFGAWVRETPGEGHGKPPQYSCLENPMDRGAWQATVHGVTKSRTRLKWLSMQYC